MRPVFHFGTEIAAEYLFITARVEATTAVFLSPPSCLNAKALE